MARQHRIVEKPIVEKIDDLSTCPKGTLLFGGHPRWRQKILNEYKNIKGIRVSDSFNDKIITRNTPLILINTSWIGHSLSDKVRKRIKYMGVKIAYVQ